MARAATAPARAPAPRRARTRPRSAPARPGPRPAARPGAAGGIARFARAGTNGLLDRLLRGRLWVGCIGALLAGIVFLNVSLLQLNREIAHTSTVATAIDRQTTSLRLRLAALESNDRTERLAAAHGMVLPAPGDYQYLRVDPRLDRKRAASRLANQSPGSGAAASAGASGGP
jgi:hypothetical protein